MICVKKYGGSLLKEKSDLSKISYQIIDEFLNLSKIEKTKFIIVISAFNNTTRKLKNEYDTFLNTKDDQNEAAFLITGELQISPLLSTMINNYGLKSVALNAMQIELLTDNNYLDANIVSVNKHKIDEYLSKYDILIISGYQGITDNKEFTTLGFNGSDYTALFLATSFSVPCEIYKDQPLKVFNDPSSLEIPYLSYDQMLFLINNGLNIFQKKVIDYAKNNNTKIILKGDKKETIISSNEYVSNTPLNIQELNSYQIKIISPYIKNDSFKYLIKKHFEIKNIFNYENYLTFFVPKAMFKMLEEKSHLILNNFKHTTFIIDDYFEYQLIFSNLQKVKIKKNKNIDIKILEDVKLC